MQAIKNFLTILKILAEMEITVDDRETVISYRALKITINHLDVFIESARDTSIQQGGYLILGKGSRKEINAYLKEAEDYKAESSCHIQQPIRK